MHKLITAALCIPLLASTAMVGQDYHHDQYDRGRNQNFYNGAYQGGRGGDYYGHDRNYADYDRRYHEGGIGPGKGALIGGVGGAALGAVFGGGAKGAIIGGAAGAGIGAVLGEHAQNERDRRY
jgi:hypothetical protein